METPSPCSAKAALCLRLTALRLLDVQHNVAQGQVGVSLIKSMCSTEAPRCNAIKQVYRPPLPTFFFPTFHLYDKMPSPRSEHNSPPADSSRITTVGKRARWEGMGGNNWAPQSHHGSRRLQSILSLTLLGRRTACNSVHADQLWERGGRKDGRTGSYGLGPRKKSHLIPQLLVQLRRLSLSHSIGGDRKGWHELSDMTGALAVFPFVSMFTPRLLTSACFWKSCSRQF